LAPSAAQESLRAVDEPPTIESSARNSSELSPSLGGFQRLQDIDLTKVPEIAAYASGSNASIDVKAAQFADLTGDASEEALVPVTSDGTFGKLGYFVVTLKDGWPEVIRLGLADRSSINGLQVDLEDGRIVETVGIYEPDDALCCPTFLEKTYYAWNGQQFQLQSRQVLPAVQK
jgi:hypothetical protein